VYYKYEFLHIEINIWELNIPFIASGKCEEERSLEGGEWGGHGLDTGLIAIEEQVLCDFVLIIAQFVCS